MIELVNYSAALGGRAVLKSVSFSAQAGEFVAVCGPNGAGKTTLLRALAGLLPGGRTDPRRIAYVEQGARSVWALTVAEATAIGRIPWRDTDQRAVAAAMEACGVTAFAARRIDQLSGGQVLRAMLARGLATGAPVLLLDEPVADLDPRAAHDIMALLARLAQEGRCVVSVLHAVELAAGYATRMLVMDNGEIRADGLPADVLPQAAAAFRMRLGVTAQPRLLPSG